MINNTIEFPAFTGARCLMMPFIQGDSNSLPEEFRSYSDIIDNNVIEAGEIGFLTIDESYVEANDSQRGYGETDRNVHIEVGTMGPKSGWGCPTPGWGSGHAVTLEDSTKVLLANSIDNTCRVWDAIEKSPTKDGDLSAYLHRYPEETGIMLNAGEVAEISIFTPHECIKQTQASNRQFFRIVGKGVTGREDHFTKNPLLN
jgi:hypothetical protein